LSDSSLVSLPPAKKALVLTDYAAKQAPELVVRRKSPALLGIGTYHLAYSLAIIQIELCQLLFYVLILISKS